METLAWFAGTGALVAYSPVAGGCAAIAGSLVCLVLGLKP